MHGGGIHLIDNYLVNRPRKLKRFLHMELRLLRKSKFNSNDTIVALLKFEDGILAKIGGVSFCNSTFSRVIGIWY